MVFQIQPYLIKRVFRKMTQSIIDLNDAVIERKIALHTALQNRGEAVTLSQIALESGVSVLSIRQFLSSGGGLAVDKLARIEVALERLGLLGAGRGSVGKAS